MHPAIKILVGALMVVLGIFSLTLSDFLQAFVTLLKGSIGPLLVLVGAFIIWLESDEWKMRRSQTKDSDVGLQKQLQEEVDKEEEEDEEPEESEDRHACPECGKEFDTERGMKIHMAQKHD
ncbi:MAG: hypothetical protein ABEJ93_02150 [Candidatus Nanohalobium sp.]